MKKLLSIIALVFFAMGATAQEKTFESVSYTADVVNAYGEKTGEKCIVAFCKGYFSNSATTDSDAWMKIIIQSDRAGFLLYEYTPEHASKDDLQMVLTNDRGETLEFLYTIKRRQIKKLIKFMSETSKVRVAIYDVYTDYVGGIQMNFHGYTKAVFLIDNPMQFVEEYNKSKNL